jgi:hypothetical protein
LEICFLLTPLSIFLEIFSIRKPTSHTGLATFLCFLLYGLSADEMHKTVFYDRFNIRLPSWKYHKWMPGALWRQDKATIEIRGMRHNWGSKFPLRMCIYYAAFSYSILFFLILVSVLSLNTGLIVKSDLNVSYHWLTNDDYVHSSFGVTFLASRRMSL